MRSASSSRSGDRHRSGRRGDRHRGTDNPEDRLQSRDRRRSPGDRRRHNRQYEDRYLDSRSKARRSPMKEAPEKSK
jgi:hypothetical protein